jgi:aryl-alcohol dehydrogenase-like predicted oxidoreductase
MNRKVARGQLEQHPLGRTGEYVGALGFGSMELRNTPHRRPRPVPNEVADVVLNTALDLGIDFIDTSIDYGDAEERIGRFIGHRRDDYFVSSKAGCPVDHMPHATTPRLVHDYSPSNLRAGLEQSLYRLRTDRIDLLQLHLSPALTVIQEDDVVATLEQFKAEGKVRFLGISSELPHLADHLALEWVDALQVPYSALEPAIEDYLPVIVARDVGLVVRGGTAQGGTGGSVSWADLSVGEEILDGESVADFLLRYTLGTSGVSTVILGTADLRHLESAARAAARGPLEAATRELVRQRVAVAAASRDSLE